MKDIRKSDIRMGCSVLSMLMILSVFTFISCKENKRNTEQNTAVHTEQVQSVKMTSAGGQLGFSSTTLIDKDSIHYNRKMAANEANNLSYSRKIKPEDWKNLIDAIDQKMFGAAKEGHGVQPIDGIDTRIIVTTTAGDISKMNAYDDPAWKSIRDIVDKYNELYK